MAVKLFNTRVKLKNDVKDNWTGANLVLLPGEIAIDNTNYNFKIGDGTKTFDQLAYVIGGAKLAGWTADTSSNTAITSSDTLETALHKLENKVDSAVSGGVTDVQIGGTSIVTNHVANIATDGTYNSSSNKIATESTVSDAIGALDVPANGTGAITGMGAGKTIATLTETDGKIAATFQDISITSSQIPDLASNAVTSIAGDSWITPSASVGSVTLTHNPITASNSSDTNTINGGTGASDTFTTVAPIVDNAGHVTGVTTTTHTITFPSADDLGLSSAMHFIGISTTDPSTAGATVSGHTTWEKGDVVLYGNKEYVLSGDSNTAANWTELGDEGSHALKTVSITGTGALSGGGTLEANRTITHNTSGVTAGTYATNSSTTLTNGGTFNIPQVTVDSYGHITAASDVTLTLPTITANNATLSITDAAGESITAFSADADTDKTISLVGDSWILTSKNSGGTGIEITHKGPGASGADITAVTTASALKVAYDAKGHITSSSALTATDVTRTATASIAATTVEGALQELATAIASGTDGNLITTNTTAQTPGSESMSNDINLHKISKTANPADLIQPTGDMIIFDCGSASVNTGTETGAIAPNASTANA